MACYPQRGWGWDLGKICQICRCMIQHFGCKNYTNALKCSINVSSMLYNKIKLGYNGRKSGTKIQGQSSDVYYYQHGRNYWEDDWAVAISFFLQSLEHSATRHRANQTADRAHPAASATSVERSWSFLLTPLFFFTGWWWVGGLPPQQNDIPNVITENAVCQAIPTSWYIKKWLCIPPGYVASRHWCPIRRCFRWHTALQFTAWIHTFLWWYLGDAPEKTLRHSYQEP